VAYYLTFFCRSGEENGSSALARFLSELTETGAPIQIKRTAFEYVDEVDVCKLATDNGSGAPAAGWVTLEISVGVEYNAQSVIHACPNDEHGIWGSDLRAELTLVGNETDWPLVQRIWAVLVTLWSAIAWDEMSRFEVNRDPSWLKLVRKLSYGTGRRAGEDEPMAESPQAVPGVPRTQLEQPGAAVVRPATVAYGEALMWLGAVVALVLGVLAALGSSLMMVDIGNPLLAPAAGPPQPPPVYSAWELTSFWATEVLVLLPGGLWLWMARAVSAGRGWARVLSGAAWCLGFGLIPALGSEGIPLSGRFVAVGVPEALGLAALALLFAPASSRYFRLARPAPRRRPVRLPPRPAGVRWYASLMFLGAGVTLVLGGIVAARSYIPFALVPGALWLWLAVGTARGRELAWGASAALGVAAVVTVVIMAGNWVVEARPGFVGVAVLAAAVIGAATLTCLLLPGTTAWRAAAEAARRAPTATR
jgi:hypothetical protein